jgi:hypothetical protein
LHAVPPADRDKVVHAAHHAFVTGFNTIALVSVAVAAVGSVAGYALVRSRDFVAAGRPAAAPQTGAGEGGSAGLGTPTPRQPDEMRQTRPVDTEAIPRSDAAPA